jgi:hypothetical protein
MVEQLLGADDDWQEPVAGYLYPKLHQYLVWLGGLIGVPLYAIGGTGSSQYVGKVDIDEETLEHEFADLGLLRNPITAYKIKADGREQEGSWVLWHDYDSRGLVEPRRQLHIMIFERADEQPGREIYAHYEDDWRSAPIAHLREKNFDVEQGVEKATDLFDDWSFITLKDSTTED